MRKYLQVCEEAARAGGQVLLDWQGKFHARKKGPKDLVTEADLASQKVIREVLLGAFPDHAFVGEESEPASKRQAVQRTAKVRRGYRWIVDPLDGTLNYVHGVPTFAVSIGLAKGGKPLVGVVFAPVTGECFSAARGLGAFLNNRRIRPARCRRLEEALVGVSISANVARGSLEVRRFLEVLYACQAVRRFGSAALSLCYVACGRLDAYFGDGVKAWDAAAGAVILQEAGGVLNGVDGSEYRLDCADFASAANQKIVAELLQAFARAKEAERL
jgi:myo-inositol-1(or 4)-monophosphatase